jgi:hypothetical protein
MSVRKSMMSGNNLLYLCYSSGSEVQADDGVSGA